MSYKIPFLDLKQVNKPFEEEFNTSFQAILASGWYINGNYLKQFEETFAAYCGTKHCIGVGNGYDALAMVLKAYILNGRLKEGDEILVSGNTFIATVLAIVSNGLKPVLIDADPITLNLDIDNLRNKITPRTRAIIPVHLYGRMAAMPQVEELASSHNLIIVEDAAQAHGAVLNNKKAGNWGDAGCFSFYPGKNLGALGDAGAITTNDTDLNNTLRAIRNYGSEQRYVHNTKGVNSRLDEIQASFLLTKLKLLDRDNKKRREIAQYYFENIHNDKIKLPATAFGEEHVWHLFTVMVEDREGLMQHMRSHGIETLIHYPIPVHKQKAFTELSSIELPICDQISATTVSIPNNITLAREELKYIVEVVNKF